MAQIFAQHGTTTFFYNPSTGRLVKVQLGNGVTEDYTYLPVTGELATMTQRQADGYDIAAFTYTYYLNGLKKSVTEITPEGGTKTISYVYDDLLRLSSATYDLNNGQQRVESYEFDANGNRLRRLVTLDGNTEEDTAYRYNRLNQIVQAGDEVIFHDSKGNISRRVSLIDDIETNYTWDNNNRLLVVEKKDGTQILKTVTYVYNGLGQRISRTLVKDGQAPVVSNYTNNTGALYSPMGIDVDSEYTQYMGGSASKKNGRVRYQLGGIGGVGRIIDELGKVVVTYDYDAFGRILPESHVTGEVDDPKERANVFRYSGEQYDEETGLIFLRNRYYDPNLGRFLSLDAHPGYMTNPQTLNPYVYFHNDPVNYRDPLGLDEISAAGWANIWRTFRNLPADTINGIEQFGYATSLVHWTRNIYNDAPQNEVSVPSYWDPNIPPDLHQFGTTNGVSNAGHRKYVSPDGGEGIYDIQGNIVTDSVNGGTYNFAVPDGTFKRDLIHTLLDVIPYLILGNSPDDPTRIWNRNPINPWNGDTNSSYSPAKAPIIAPLERPIFSGTRCF